jgi:hypothetical protein
MPQKNPKFKIKNFRISKIKKNVNIKITLIYFSAFIAKKLYVPPNQSQPRTLPSNFGLFMAENSSKNRQNPWLHNWILKHGKLLPV